MSLPDLWAQYLWNDEVEVNFGSVTVVTLPAIRSMEPNLGHEASEVEAKKIAEETVAAWLRDRLVTREDKERE